MVTGRKTPVFGFWFGGTVPLPWGGLLLGSLELHAGDTKVDGIEGENGDLSVRIECGRH